MNSDVEQRIRDRCMDDGLLYPAYEDYCFANIPHTIQSIFGTGMSEGLPEHVLPDTGDWDRVIVFLVDGFGLSNWKEYGDHDFIQRMESNGTVTPLTSIYPSETAAAMTSFHTAKLPSEHGSIGWNVYDPEWDSAFKLFGPEVKSGSELTPEQQENAYIGDSIYPKLNDAGVDSHHVVSMDYTYDGATLHSYTKENPSEAGQKLLQAAEVAEDPSYLFCYFPQLDGIGHDKGNRSLEYERSTYYVFDVIQDVIDNLPETEDTLVAITADHGQVDKSGGYDLEDYDWVMNALRRHIGTDIPVKFSGSPRNVHLHLQDGTVNDVADKLRQEFGAHVFTRREVLDRKLFGPGTQSPEFKRRVGDLVVTHETEAIWYGEESDEFDLVGLHGGLHPNEMLVPFATAELEELKQ